MKTTRRDFVIRSFSIHCEQLSNKDDLHSKATKMKKDFLTLKGWLKEAGLLMHPRGISDHINTNRNCK